MSERPRATLWLGPEAVRLLTALSWPEDTARVFPENLAPDRLHTIWVGIREEAGLPGLRIHDTRHIWASQGLMNGLGLTTVGRLLGHRKRRTTAIYAHLDDATLHDAAAQAAAIIAGAMGYRAEPPPPAGRDRQRRERRDAGHAVGRACGSRAGTGAGHAPGRRGPRRMGLGVRRVARSTPPRPRGRPGRMAPEADPGVDMDAVAEAARPTGCMEI